jgi:tRNA-Thr(GGU) m(6)t(6)A37 methyltransferase TsaA
VDVHAIGRVHSAQLDRGKSSKQGWEAGVEAGIEVFPQYGDGLDGLAVGQDVLVLTWLHQSERATLKVHPRDDRTKPLTGVFATRSSDRPNPIGVHRVTILDMKSQRWLTVRGLEAIDATPIIDIKPLLDWERS